MSKRRYANLQELLDDCSPEHREIADKLREIFLSLEGVRESVKWDCLHFNYPNGMWIYVNMRNKKHPIIGFSRGAWMVKHNHLLTGLFDEVKTVVGKITLYSIDTIEQKGLRSLAKYIYQLPSGIGVL